MTTQGDHMIALLAKRVRAHIDRADMRADSALDETRERRERLRDYLRFEQEAIAAQLCAEKHDVWMRLQDEGFVK